MKEKYYSQYSEDKWITENLKLPDIGIFIDIGAAHPEKFSNSLHFEEKGWNVICIEPQQEFYQLLKEKRKTVLQAAIRNFDGTTDFFVREDKYLSSSNISVEGVVNKISVLSYKLSTILKMYFINKVDILSIDVEGGEMEILESINFKDTKIEILIVEFNTIGYESKELDLVKFLKKKGYGVVHKTFANLIFKKVNSFTNWYKVFN